MRQNSVIVYNFMTRNRMQSIRQKFPTLLNDQLKLKITKINLNFPNSRYRETWSHLKKNLKTIVRTAEGC